MYITVGILSEVYAALTWSGTNPPQSPSTTSYAVRLLVEAPSKIQILDTNLKAGMMMLEIAAAHNLTARRIHDARHAATALTFGVYKVYTYDISDWQKLQSDGIEIVGPPSVITS